MVPAGPQVSSFPAFHDLSIWPPTVLKVIVNGFSLSEGLSTVWPASAELLTVSGSAARTGAAKAAHIKTDSVTADALDTHFFMHSLTFIFTLPSLIFLLLLPFCR